MPIARFITFYLFALLLFTGFVLPSCGRKGPIIVPGTVLPKAVTDLRAEVKGGAAILSWTMPASNTKGTPLTDLAGFLVLRAEMPEDNKECACNFEKVGYVDLEYPKDALIQGNRVVWADKGPGLVYGRKYVYKVTPVNTGNFQGEPSEPATARFLMPPAMPAGLAAHSLNRSALITWEPVAKDTGGNAVTDIAGYNVYRVQKAGETPGSPVNTEPVKDERYEDFNLTNNVTYFYTVAALRGKESPFTEGDAAGPVSATPSDKLPPAAPRGLQAVPGVGMVLLSWEPGPEPDIAGYVVYRKAEGEKDFKRLTGELYTRITYKDAEVSSGATYTYAVTAVDNASPPNESPFSEEATIRVP